jgi:superfamily II DNA or RNA helicase
MRSKLKTVRCVEGGGLYFRPEEGEFFDKEFRVQNPEWVGAIRRGAYHMPPKWITPSFELPIDHPWAGGLVLPRFCASPMYYVDSIEKLYDGESIDSSMAPEIQLRDYQNRAVNRAVSKGHGILCAPCGAGKTAIGVGIISEIQQKTLVLVHTGDLLTQWRERIESWMPNVTVGMRGLGKNKDGDVVIATVQTLMRMKFTELYKWASQFGLTILDEAHHSPARTFVKVMGGIPSRYRFGLTATPDREDGLTKFMYWTFGDKIWSISHDELRKLGLIAVPELKKVYTTHGADVPTSTEYTKAITDLTLDEDRNQLIIDLTSSYFNDGRCILVLSERVGHCEELNEMLKKRGVLSECLVGAVSSKRREEILQRARTADVRVLFATQLADEGLDVPRLDTLILATPASSPAKLEQRCGRIMRGHPDKMTPLVVDIRDAWPKFIGGQRKRDRVYGKLNLREQ